MEISYTIKVKFQVIINLVAKGLLKKPPTFSTKKEKPITRKPIIKATTKSFIRLSSPRIMSFWS